MNFFCDLNVQNNDAKMHVKSPQELQLHSYLATIPFQLTKTMIINFLEVKSRLDEQGFVLKIQDFQVL